MSRSTHCASKVAALTASREEIQAHVAPAVSPRTTGNSLFAAELNHVCLWIGYQLLYDAVRHGYFGVVKESTGEWKGALFSSVMRVGSVCVRRIDVHLYGVDLVSVIFRSAFAHDRQAPSQASWCGDHQLQLAVTFGIPANSTRMGHDEAWTYSFSRAATTILSNCLHAPRVIMQLNNPWHTRFTNTNFICYQSNTLLRLSLKATIFVLLRGVRSMANKCNKNPF